MEFRTPFDSEQRHAAAQLYRQYRSHMKLLRADFPPITEHEKALFRRYHDLAQDFARELVAADDKVNVRRLNNLQQAVQGAAMKYYSARATRELDGPD